MSPEYVHGNELPAYNQIERKEIDMKARYTILAAAIATTAFGVNAAYAPDEGTPQDFYAAIYQQDEGTPQDFYAAYKQDEGTPQNLYAALEHDEGVPQNMVG
jgi:hypothetical protein